MAPSSRPFLPKRTRPLLWALLIERFELYFSPKPGSERRFFFGSEPILRLVWDRMGFVFRREHPAVAYASSRTFSLHSAKAGFPKSHILQFRRYIHIVSAIKCSPFTVGTNKASLDTIFSLSLRHARFSARPTCRIADVYLH